MNVVANELLVDLDHAVQPARYRLDAVEFASRLNMAEHLTLVHHERDEGIARTPAFAGPNKAARLRRVDIAAVSSDTDAWEEIDDNRRRQPAGSL